MAFRPNPLALAIPPDALHTWYAEQLNLSLLQDASSSSSSSSRQAAAADRSNPATSSSSPSTFAAPSFSASPAVWAARLDTHLERHQLLQPIGTRLGFGPGFRVRDVVGDPRPWIPDFFGLTDVIKGYDLPRSWEVGNWRLRQNLACYSGNYVVLAVLILLSVFYKLPVAAMGLYLLYKVGEELRALDSSTGFAHNASVPVSRRTVVFRSCLRWAFYFLSWLIIYFFRIASAMLLSAAITTGVVVAHGLLRCPPPVEVQQRTKRRQ